MANPSPYLAWWTSIETDLRKSLLVGARQDPERLHDLLRTAFEAGQTSATPPSPSTAPEADPEKDFSDWMEKRGALGAGAVPERIFFAGHSAGRRSALASRPAEVEKEYAESAYSNEKAAEVDDEWVSADDRMPEDASKIYLVNSSWGVRTAYKHDPEWAGGCFQDTETSSDEGMYDYDRCKGAFVVYHWRKMPAAPSHTTNKENGQ